jgi:squalene-hopene/tetraprenyl-beta-curcumene cyclase
MERILPLQFGTYFEAGSSPPSSPVVLHNDQPAQGSAPQMRFGKIDDLASRVAVAVDAARKYLFSQQHEDGYWCGELEADTTLESDYILLHTLLGTGNQERFDKAARHILNHQNEDGGWSIYAAGLLISALR